MRESSILALTSTDTGLTSTGDTVYGSLGTQTIGSFIGTYVIAPALSVIGVIFLVLIIYFGFMWMTARGEEKQVTSAKSVMTNAIIGLILTLSAFAITNFIFGALT